MTRANHRIRQWVPERDPYSDLSFPRDFDAPEWKQLLNDLRTAIPKTLMPSNEVDELIKNNQAAHSTDEAATDLNPILAEYKDFLLIDVGVPPSTNEPLDPTFVLLEFLLALGFVDGRGFIRVADIAHQAKISAGRMASIISGELPISRSISKRLSEVFETRADFWSDLQREHDLWWGNSGATDPACKQSDNSQNPSLNFGNLSFVRRQRRF